MIYYRGDIIMVACWLFFLIKYSMVIALYVTHSSLGPNKSLKEKQDILSRWHPVGEGKKIEESGVVPFSTYRHNAKNSFFCMRNAVFLLFF